MLNLNLRVQAQIERTAWFRAVMNRGAEAVKDHAEQESPIRLGIYQDKFRWFVAQDNPRERIVENFDAGAIPIEFGSVNNPVYAPLRRGARAAGLNPSETP